MTNKKTLKSRSFYEVYRLCDFVNQHNIDIVNIVNFNSLLYLFYYEENEENPKNI